jgi:tyrosine-protein phosphatase YwqE
MTDMHTHILYGVDDGADSREISNYLLTQARQNGIERIVLTPHQNEELKRSEELKERFKIFKEEFKDFNIDFYLGSEIYYYDSMIKDLDNKELLTINDTKYILVEFSTRMETDIASIIYDLIVRGYKPIVAHIERYHYLELKDYDDIIVYGGIKGNRIEHLFSNIIDICNHPNVKMIDDNSLIEIKDKSFIPNINYQFVSFYSLDNNTIISLSGFKYNLDNYNLKMLDNLCLSNEIISNDCYVSLNGKILIIYSLKK